MCLSYYIFIDVFDLTFSSNLISSLAIPTGELKYSIFASLPAFKVSLRNNKLTTIPTDFVWSPSIFDLDLSENLITTVPAVLYWISPVLDQFSNDTYCACNVTVLQDPAKRVVDLTANRIPASMFASSSLTSCSIRSTRLLRCLLIW